MKRTPLASYGRKAVVTRLLAVVCTVFSCTLSGQGLPQRANSIFAGYLNAPGCAIAVDSADQKLLRAGYGLADLEWNTPIGPETIFEAGSVSKQFVAAAVLLLESRGLISLEDEIQKWFSEIPRYAEPITLRHLMLHTSGLRDWGVVAAMAGWPRTTRVHTHDDVLEILSRQRGLNHEPGQKFSYTNSGYNLLTMLVERATGGMSMAEFTRREFFQPLGMSHTSWRDDFTRVVPGRAQAYQRAGGQWKLLMPFENVHGNGGLLTTVGDLLIWTDALLDGRLGRPDVSAKMRTMGLLNDGSASGYGGGLFLNPVREVRAVRHTGSTAGYRAVLSAWPDQDIRSAILCNRADANPGRLELELLAGELPLSRATTNVTAAVPSTHHLSPSRLSQYVAKFHSDEVDAIWTVLIDGGSLKVRRRNGEAPRNLRPIALDRFSAAGGYTLEFERDKSGNISGFLVSASRALKVPFSRIE